MNFYKKIAYLFIIPSLLFGAEEGDINIYIKIPTANIVRLATYYTANHQSYLLTPEEIKHNNNQYPIFSPQDGLSILHKDSYLLENIPKNTFIPLPVKIHTESDKQLILVSMVEKDSKIFELQSITKGKKNIPIKLYLINPSDKRGYTNPVEVVPGKSYFLNKLKDKHLYIFIPKEYEGTKREVNLRHYALPLEVKYHTP